MKKTLIFTSLFLFMSLSVFAQFGKNKVQYKELDWHYVQTRHFDIFFSNNGELLADFTSKAAEEALSSIEKNISYKINNRITIIIYNSHNDFQETNVIDEYLSEGIQGFTELFKNRVVVQYDGSYARYRHLIHHELVHAVINDMFYGGSLQNLISSNISIRLPLWFNEGLAEYLSLGWDTNTDMFIRDAAISEYLPDIENLGGYFAYRGGQSVFYYISQKYGEKKVGELVNRIRGLNSFEEGFKAALGLSVKELSERWKKEIKRNYWPDINLRKDPDDFSRRLTDHREDGGFYNTSPTISPQGDKIAFISNRDTYFDVFLMNAIDGKIIKKLIRGNRTADFEELNVLTPGLTWSPDGKKISISAKSKGFDVIYIIDVETSDRETLPVKLDGISSVNWSPDGNKIAFVGYSSGQSDIYIYNFHDKTLESITDDIFTDSDPSWSPDSRKIFFVSDRKNYLDAGMLPDTFNIYHHEFNTTEIYSFNLDSKKIEKIFESPGSIESSPLVSPDEKEILFISDINGINNIYRKKIVLDEESSYSSIIDIPAVPVTNSLNGLYQLSISEDGKKLVFTSMYQSAYSIFLMNNPFEIRVDSEKLEPTVYMSEILFKDSFSGSRIINEQESIIDTVISSQFDIHTGPVLDTAKVYGEQVEIDFSKYVFGDKTFQPDTSKPQNEIFNLENYLDEDGNYAVNKYKITFSPDLIYANAGYSSLYGLLGTTVLSFSDVLGNHRIIGVTSLQIDLKNSDYGLAYYYLPKRINLGIEAFHTARFVGLRRGTSYNIYRFRNYGGVVSAYLPLDRFYRFETGISWLNVSRENLDNPGLESDKATYILPSLSFVHDNTLWGFTAPIDGTRYRLTAFGNPGFTNKRLSFYTITTDYRKYFRLGDAYSFVLRLSGGFSSGANPQRFFIGGTDNWINRKFSTGQIPLESAGDFAFLSAALPLRGFNYAEQIGSKYALLNMELRFPLIRYLVTGGLPLLFRNIMGVMFVDMGSAWNNTKQLQFFAKNQYNSTVSKDLLTGMGFGARVFFLYFLLRFDVAWAYDFNSFSEPKFYISLGADF